MISGKTEIVDETEWYREKNYKEEQSAESSSKEDAESSSKDDEHTVDEASEKKD